MVEVGEYYIWCDPSDAFEYEARVLQIEGQRAQVTLSDWGEGEVTRWIDVVDLLDPMTWERVADASA